MVSTQAAWLVLVASIAAESLGTAALTLSAGFSRIVPSIITALCYILAIWLMALATKRLEMSLAYAVWAGGSAAMTTLIGVVCFGDSMGGLKALGLCTAIAGIVLLNLSASGA